MMFSFFLFKWETGIQRSCQFKDNASSCCRILFCQIFWNKVEDYFFISPESPKGGLWCSPKRALRKDHQQSHSFSLPDSSFAHQLFTECKIPAPLRKPVSSHVTTGGCHAEHLQPAKAKHIQKAKGERNEAATFKPVHLKLKGLQTNSDGNYGWAVLLETCSLKLNRKEPARRAEITWVHWGDLMAPVVYKQL